MSQAQENLAPKSDCIFCRIVAGQVPCYRFMEDDAVLAFLDVGPLSRGHALIIPKAHYATMDALPDELAARCGSVMPRLIRAIQSAVGATASNVLQNNGPLAHQAVDHVHFHIIPKTLDTGLGIDWPAGTLGETEAKDLVDAIIKAM